MTKDQKAALNMARFIKSQSLTLIEKLNGLPFDEQTNAAEQLHELAERLANELAAAIEARGDE